VTGGATGVVGTGTLTIAMGAASFSVSMVPGSNTLADLRDAINESAQNPGVNAALVNDINGTHLVLAGTQTGAANALRITASGGNGGLNQFVHDPPATTTNMTVLSAAQDAIALIAGFEVHDADNSIDGAIEGVTIELKKAATGTVTNLEVALDGAGIRERANRFVSAYNVLASQVAKLRAYDPATKVAGPLLGDSMLRGIESQMRRLLSDEVAGLGVSPYRTLASLGITSTATGTLELDATKFDAAIKIDPNAASRVFTSESGVSAKLLKLLDAGLADGAELSSRDTRLTAKSKDIVKQKAQLEVRMQQVQARYQRQFNALDSLLTQLQSTSSYLARQLASTSSSG
jgi:flagellar hook-associated protein 2